MAAFSDQQAIQLAIAHHRSGRLSQAEAIYRDVLQRHPDNADALHYLGVLLHQTGNSDAAADLICRSIALDPLKAEYHNNLGTVLHATGRLDQAAESFRNAIRLKPDCVEAHSSLGRVLRARGQIDEAAECFRRASSLRPHDAVLHFDLGNALKDTHRPTDAIDCYRKAIALDASFAEAHNNLGNILRDLGRFDEAIDSYRKAIQLRPDGFEAHNNCGAALQACGQLEDAAQSYRTAISLKPDHAEGHNNLGTLLRIQGRLDQAIECYRKAIQLRPDRADMHSNLLLALHYSPDHDAPAIFQEHLRWAQQHAHPLKRHIRPHTNDRNPDRRIRLGYVSPDFRQHSVAFFTEPILAAHDHQRFEVFCYSDVLRPDAVTRQLQGHADQWRHIAPLPDDQLAELIRRDRIDVLVDLAGHTRGNRMLLFALKPAPVQVAYLGYPDTTGLDTIDYRLVDAHVDPPGLTDQFHTERLIRLPDSMLLYRPPALTPQVAALPALQTGHVTFASFNDFAKVTPQAIDLWCSILHALPGSRLILKNHSLADPAMRRRTQDLFGQRAMAPDRLELRPPVPSLPGHLDQYNRVDIALDTSPYTGTTTTCEALWMGVPVITLSGATHVSRVGLSLLSNVGLGHLVASSPRQYLELALKLAGDLPRLGELRSALRQRMRQSPLMDTRRFVHHLEDAYRAMWRNCCSACADAPGG